MYRFSKTISIILILAMLLESCAVYRSSPVSIQDAEKTHKRVLMIRNDGKKVRLKKIEFEDGNYYGIARVHGRKAKVLIDESQVKAYRPINPIVSTLGTVGIVVFSLVVVVAVIFAVTWGNMDLGWGDENNASRRIQQ